MHQTRVMVPASIQLLAIALAFAASVPVPQSDCSLCAVRDYTVLLQQADDCSACMSRRNCLDCCSAQYVSCMGQSRSLNQWKACFPARKECINMCAFKSSHLNEPCPPAEQEIVTAAPVDECPLDDEMCQELDDLCDWLEPNTACCEKAMELCEGDSVTNCAIVDDLCN
eukprot:TRINITY_DN2090_c0_g1_i1.p1 TRINITY_DN2090_c0_g1~~TRINITY_DN2090_c0_g1_i1.p1  ORF type:complete len:169 (+),score=19.44 TRINITY_DN2090_c0_g1_i1:135-641(+)